MNVINYILVIDWCLMPTLAVFQLYCGVMLKKLVNSLQWRNLLLIASFWNIKNPLQLAVLQNLHFYQ